MQDQMNRIACMKCGGSGTVWKQINGAKGQRVDELVPCPKCGGKGGTFHMPEGDGDGPHGVGKEREFTDEEKQSLADVHAVPPETREMSREELRAFYGAMHNNYGPEGILTDQEMHNRMRARLEVRQHNQNIDLKRAAKKAKKLRRK